MKRKFILGLAVVMLLSGSVVPAGQAKAEKNFWGNAQDWLGNAWESTQEAVEDAWNSTGEFVGDAWDATGEFVGNAWDDVSNFASEAWKDVSSFTAEAWSQTTNYLGEKKDELSAWFSVTGNDALEKLKAAYDEQAQEMEWVSELTNEMWLVSMEYADEYGIARVTQAKLLLAALVSAAEKDGMPEQAQAVKDMILNSGIENQTTAEAVLANMIAAVEGIPEVPDEDDRYYLGKAVKTGTDNGYFGEEKIDSKDPHYGWTLGDFFVSGHTSVYQDKDGNPVFLKTLGDRVELWFQLEQDIDCLNRNDALSIAEDANGYNEDFEISKTNFKRGALIVRHTDYRNKAGEPQLYTDYLSGIVSSGADTTVQMFEEGDYEITLNYEIQQTSMKVIKSYTNYKITFKFSVRNGNCMVYPFDVVTGAELTNTALTENGFKLDLARSRYLDINVKRETLAEGALGLTEDVRFNRPAQDGEEYTQEGIYTITVSNPYTNQQTVKQIYVGTNKILMAHMVTGLSVAEIRDQIAKGARIAEDGTIIGMVKE